jgi:signal transduction histidine kinase
MATEAERESFLRLLTAEENETKRIANELHHDLGQFLGMIKLDFEMGIQKIKDNQVKLGIELLQKVLPKIQQAILQVQKIGMSLWPPTLENAHLGILATTSWLCREFQKAHADFQIETQIGVQEREVPNFLKPTIYKILREALNNAKLRKAALVHIFLLKRDPAIELTIQDNGEGFTMEKEGLAGSRLASSLADMRGRTEITGGSFAIESVIGKGTIIRASWPIKS